MHLTLTSPVQSSGRFFTRGNVRGYCFGFNGKEKVDEVYGDANAYDFSARLYDPRLGRWLSLDPLMSKYPELSPYNFVANNPIKFIDFDGKDFGIKVDHKTKTIIITATYYTTKENVSRTQDALNVWNNTSNMYYRVGNKKTGFEYYKVSFQLKAEGKDNVWDVPHASDNDKTGNSVTVYPDVYTSFKENPNRAAFTNSHKHIALRESRKDEVLPNAHEIGHTLIGSTGHEPGTIMNESIESLDPYSNNVIKSLISTGIIANVLGTAGIGNEAYVNSNSGSVINVEKGDGYDDLNKNGKVVSEKQMIKQLERQSKKESKQKSKNGS